MLKAWEQVHNCYRPHQALEYRTPKQFLEEFALARPPQCHECTGRVHVLYIAGAGGIP